MNGEVSTYLVNRCPKFWASLNVSFARYFCFKAFKIKMRSTLKKGQLFYNTDEAEQYITCFQSYALIILTLLLTHVRMLPVSAENRSIDVSYAGAIFCSIILKDTIFLTPFSLSTCLPPTCSLTACISHAMLAATEELKTCPLEVKLKD